MADIWMDVDTALSEVPVNIMALIDDTDFKTRETAIAYNAAGMDLVWNFVTSAGAYTQTAVTPTTGGNYDWAHQGDGMYSIEIPASGGASINNDTEGYGWFTGIATGVLPWRGPIIGFRAAAINDSLCDTNTTGLVAPTVAGRTLDISAAGNAGIDLDNVALTNACYPLALIASGTLSGTHSSTTADLGTNAPSVDIGGQSVLFIPTRGFMKLVDSYNTGTGVATFSPSTAATLTNGDAWYLYPSASASTTNLPSVLVSSGTGAGQINLSSGAVPVQSGTGTGQLNLSSGNVTLTDASLTSAKFGTGAITEIQSGLLTAASANTTRYQKNTASQKVFFTLVDSTDHVSRKTGITVTAQRSLDGAAFGSATGSVTEVGNGVYYLSTSQADINADDVVFRFTGTACDPVELHVVTY